MVRRCMRVRRGALTRHVRDWEELAAVDPFRAVLRPPGRELMREEFFASGERDVERALALARRHGRPIRFRRALDFGCGIGRLTRPLAARFDEVVGVDAARTMVETASRLHPGIGNLRFLEGTSAPGGGFDLVLCLLVLQHFPSAESARRSIAELTSAVAPGGVAVSNPAFDVTPDELVAAIITDRGVAHPPYTESLKKLVEG